MRKSAIENGVVIDARDLRFARFRLRMQTLGNDHIGAFRLDTGGTVTFDVTEPDRIVIRQAFKVIHFDDRESRFFLPFILLQEHDVFEFDVSDLARFARKPAHTWEEAAKTDFKFLPGIPLLKRTKGFLIHFELRRLLEKPLARLEARLFTNLEPIERVGPHREEVRQITDRRKVRVTE